MDGLRIPSFHSIALGKWNGRKESPEKLHPGIPRTRGTNKRVRVPQIVMLAWRLFTGVKRGTALSGHPKKPRPPQLKDEAVAQKVMLAFTGTGESDPSLRTAPYCA